MDELSWEVVSRARIKHATVCEYRDDCISSDQAWTVWIWELDQKWGSCDLERRGLF